MRQEAICGGPGPPDGGRYVRYELHLVMWVLRFRVRPGHFPADLLRGDMAMCDQYVFRAMPDWPPAGG